MAGAAHQGDTGGERNHGAQCSEPARRLVDRPLDSLPFFCRRAVPRQKAPPLGGSKPKAQRGGFFCRRAVPRQKAPPSGGSKP
ncbi:hypothetical protein RAN3_3132 [plant metagenome]|uniref:Uncharacterized protein n=1 Tax=plant metagenome TaxID=1297885 RepID=A0A484U6R3_9ZZZZ